ncbi:MAG: restriction endonuclease subunit S [Acetobacter sp.]|nr:restriction endonuclease subunit S [Acetobacter sp.]
MELDVVGWKSFYLGRLFDIKKGKRLTSEEQEDGPHVYVGAIDSNNGVANHISQMPIHEGNTISLSYNGSVGEAFYQSEPYWATDDVNALYPKYDGFNKFIGLFIVAVIRQEKYRFSYGRKWTLESMNNSDIKLPILHNTDGTPFFDDLRRYSEEGYVPDWQFMEDYIKSLNYKPLTTLNINNTRDLLDIDKWKSFKVGRIFQILNGKGITAEEIEDNPGSFNAVQSGEDNNGVLGKIDLLYCKKMKYTISERACLTVARSGSAGFVSFQSEGCVVGDSAKILLLPEDVASTGVYLFVQTLLMANRFKYAYGRKVTEDKYADDEIKLPILVSDNGKPILDNDNRFSDEGYVPDWYFMEKYISSLSYGDKI